MLKLLLALPLLAAIGKPAPPADLNSPPAEARKTESGLVTVRLREGKGEAIRADQIASMRVTVWKSDGTVVQHVPPGQTTMLPVAKMLPGWREAVLMMSAGEIRRAWIPSALGAGKIREGESLVIDTELVEIVDPPTTPADVAAPPAGATVTASGLAYRVLRPGTGARHPKRSDRVTVHYSGWTTDGRLFDSSINRGIPSTFPLDGVIQGWIEGLQLMVEGEKTRFWIPARLAYAHDRTKPQGMLVFDVELLRIQ